MKTNKLEINDLHTVKTEEEMEFYPGHQKDLVQLKEEPLDVINDDIPKDPLAIEETNLVKSENFKVENDKESEISLNNEVSTPFNFNMKTNELQINDKHLHTVNTEEQIRFDPGHVTIDEEIIKGSTKKNYICNFCQKSFNFKSGLKRHLIIHSKEKNYVCSCLKSFNLSSALKVHLNIHTKEKNYICDFCQKSFNFRSGLIRHLIIDSDDKNYVCNFCQKSFKQSYDLKMHLNIHTKEKNYVCNFCQKIFNCYSNLKVHINLHTKEKNYICNICQKSYFQKSALKLHLITHTKEKNYN
ncbi:uncharacterized protein LOC142321330 [Lycorma delicatula]|uniref:uncharacterized protein LOC142321330 n=1 Tax=Lycorma delicatula TaxID=130591 RepID=UPI003F5161FF